MGSKRLASAGSGRRHPNSDPLATLKANHTPNASDMSEEESATVLASLAPRAVGHFQYTPVQRGDFELGRQRDLSNQLALLMGECQV